MDCLSLPEEFPWWGSESDSSRPGIPAETPRERLGTAPLLWDRVCCPKCATTSNDRPRTVRPGSLVRDELDSDVVRSKRYHLLTDEVLKDPFNPVELSHYSNKTVNFDEADSPPCLLPAFTTTPPAINGPCHSGAQHGAGGTQMAGKEEMAKLREAMERQARLIESLIEQQILMARQIHSKENEEEKGTKNLASVRGSSVAWPAPIRMQKMTNTDDPEAYLPTFERAATAAGWPRDQWTLVLIPSYWLVTRSGGYFGRARSNSI